MMMMMLMIKLCARKTRLTYPLTRTTLVSNIRECNLYLECLFQISLHSKKCNPTKSCTLSKILQNLHIYSGIN